MDLEEIVCEVLGQSPGTIGARLVSEVISLVFKRTGNIPPENLMNLLDQMVAAGRIVEVEYVVPSMDYRIKSLYFPAGTTVSVKESV